MKKYIFMAATLMMMGIGMSSCSNENDAIDNIEQNTKKQLTFTVSFTNDAATRAVWETSKKPKFVVGDKIGVYSANNLTAVEFTVTEVDASGNATISGTANVASEYHLVFPFKAGTTYNTSTGDISGFDDFGVTSNNDRNSLGTYPTKALHYAKATGGATSVTFQNLCAILKVSYPNFGTMDAFIVDTVNGKNPVIHTTGEGSPKVTATENNPYTLLLSEAGVHYYPVAPGNVTVVIYYTSEAKTFPVVAGKVYRLHVNNAP